MAVYFVPAEPTRPIPADGDNYTYNPPRASAYDLRPAPMRQEARIASLEARIAELENDQQITAAEHGEQIADLEARIAKLESRPG